MINSKKLFEFFNKKNINFFCGVPDSVLKSLSSFFDKKNNQHLIATNEGSAIGIAIGYHLSTKKIPCVYLQNSGLGNAINPLSSITHKKVYSIPILILIGWRGGPNSHDEPQHKVTGKITKNLLKLLDIKYCLIKSYNDFNKISNLIKFAKKENKPVACLIENNILFSNEKIKKLRKNDHEILRSNIIEVLLKNISYKTLIISSTGYTSRELFQLRKLKKLNNGKDFYMVGGMGHATSVSLGASIFNKNNTVCLDGDGSLLMHMGSLFSISIFGKKNLKYILINNNSHESVGMQPTYSEKIDFKLFSKSLGFNNFYRIIKNRDIQKILSKFLKSKGPSFLEIKTKSFNLRNLERPKKLIEIKNFFMNK